VKALRNFFLVYAGLCTLGSWASLGALFFGDHTVVSPFVILCSALMYSVAALVALNAAAKAE
jgi:hypothetical protein